MTVWTRRQLMSAMGALPVIGLGRTVAPAAPDPDLQPGYGDVIDPSYELSPPLLEDPLDPGVRLPAPEVSAQAAPRISPAAAGVPFTFTYTPFPIQELPVGLAPYHLSTPFPLVDTGVHDASGVRMVLLGGKLYDHPVAQAQYGINLLESYRLTGDTRYLDRAAAQAARIIVRRVLRDGGWWYPYPFSLALHGGPDLLRAPWYSMMAQGQALSLFVRLYQATNFINWKNAADATFLTFLSTPAAGKPWGVRVVSNHLWLEEYPQPSSTWGDQTYNGHTFAAYGLWDYWVLTRDARALLMLQGALTTTRDVLLSIRIRGWRSKYCLRHGRDAGSYHGTHMVQLLIVHGITQDVRFAQYADLLARDWPAGAAPGTVRFMPGTHTGYTFNTSGTATGSKTLVLPNQSWATMSARERVINRTGLWYVMSNGALAGYRVLEAPGVRFRLGLYSQLGYRILRRASVTVTAPPAYTVDANGNMTRVTTTYRAGDPATVSVRGWINGVEHLRLGDGPYAGRWVGTSTLTVV